MVRVSTNNSKYLNKFRCVRTRTEALNYFKEWLREYNRFTVMALRVLYLQTKSSFTFLVYVTTEKRTIKPEWVCQRERVKIYGITNPLDKKVRDAL